MLTASQIPSRTQREHESSGSSSQHRGTLCTALVTQSYPSSLVQGFLSLPAGLKDPSGNTPGVIWKWPCQNSAPLLIPTNKSFLIGTHAAPPASKQGPGEGKRVLRGGACPGTASSAAAGARGHRRAERQTQEGRGLPRPWARAPLPQVVRLPSSKDALQGSSPDQQP